MEFLNVDFHLGWASWKTGMDESAAVRRRTGSRSMRGIRCGTGHIACLNPPLVI